MAYEDAVADFNALETMTECAGCGKALSLLESHLLLTVKAQRQVVETVDARLVDAKTDDEGKIIKLAEVPEGEDQDTTRYFIGTRSGAAEHVVVHNVACAIEFLNKQKDLKDKPKVKLLEDDGVERSNK
jgi:hypothetical protein